jgi:hypothetical protein
MLAVTHDRRLDVSPRASAERKRACRHNDQPLHTISVRIDAALAVSGFMVEATITASFMRPG